MCPFVLELKERLINLRARIQSYRSGRFAYGWVASVSSSEFSIDFNKRDCGCIGDRYHIEAVDGSELFMVDAVLTECLGDRGVFAVTSELRACRATEGMRIRVAINAVVKFERREYPSMVVDLAADGLGVVTNAEIARGRNAEIEMSLEQDVLNLIGRSLYCHEIRTDKLRYRVGLFIPKLDQLIDPIDGNLRRAVLRSV